MAIRAAIIFYSGTRLSLHGDLIAGKSGLGRTWIGVILMVSVTSLPELVTGIGSRLLPRLAGRTCMFDMLTLAMPDIERSGPLISALAHQGHVLPAAFGMLLPGFAATWLPHPGDEIATITGPRGTCVGSIFAAIAVSFLEIVVSSAKLTMGAADLAAGSNLFNIAILAIDDVLPSIATSHAITALAAMTMVATIAIALTYRPQRQVLLFSWQWIGVALAFLLASLALYAGR